MIALAGLGLITIYARAAAQAPPVVEYRLDEGEGGSAHDGAGLHAGAITAPEWVGSSDRAALRFDGRETVLTVQGGEALQFPEAFSLAVWFRADAVSRSDPLGLIGKSPTFRLLVYPPARKFLIDIHGTKGERIYESPEAPVRIGVWHHVALTYAPGDAVLYFDGVAVFESDSDIGAPVAGNAPLRIGLGVNVEQRRHFKGMMANVRIWDRAITAQEVRRIVTTEKQEFDNTFRGPDDLAPDTGTTVHHDIGDRKQLFIDERFIESSRDVRLTMNPPAKLGPVIEPDPSHPWEKGWVGGCSLVEDDGLCRMWYRAYEGGRDGKLGRGALCYAESTDGIHWDKPILGLVERDGSKENNILDAPIGTVFVDPKALPEQKYKLVCSMHWPDPQEGGMYIHISPDGVHWALHPVRLFPFVPDTTNHAFYDPRIDKYVIYVRTWDPLRKVGRIETDDIMQPWPYDGTKAANQLWGKDKVPVPRDEIPTAISYDELDPEVSDIYTPQVHQYPWTADAYFAFPSPYLHFPEPPVGKFGNDGLLDIQLAVSRTGEWFDRPFREPYIALGPDGEPDSRCLYMAQGWIRRGNEVYQYYAGYSHSHGEYVGFPEIVGLGRIMRAVQRLDGFVSASADYTGGTLTTPPLTFAGTRLELNVSTSAMGEVRVELLDERGEAIEGFGAADCDPIHGNFIARIVTWNGKSDVSSLAGRPVKLHFVMRAAKLYAFQFVG